MTSKLTDEAPHPMGSFEDTTHAYEVGYAAGLATGQQAYKKIQAERDIIAAATAETLALACLQEAQRRRKMATDLKARAPANADNNLQYNRWIAGAIGLEVMAGKAHEITPTDALAALARIKGEAAGLRLRAEMAEDRYQGVKVKPLVWGQISDRRGGAVAMGVSGAYVIRRTWSDRVRMADTSGSGWHPFENEDAAKDAAYSAEAARILSALDLPTTAQKGEA